MLPLPPLTPRCPHPLCCLDRRRVGGGHADASHQGQPGEAGALPPLLLPLPPLLPLPLLPPLPLLSEHVRLGPAAGLHGRRAACAL